MLTQDIAQKLDMPPEALERASLRAYLEARRREIEAQLFLLVKKHGVQTVEEFDAAVQAGRIREVDGFEDFFVFDRLEAERDKVLAGDGLRDFLDPKDYQPVFGRNGAALSPRTQRTPKKAQRYPGDTEEPEGNNSARAPFQENQSPACLGALGELGVKKSGSVLDPAEEPKSLRAVLPLDLQ